MTGALEHHSSKYMMPFVGCVTLSKSFNQSKSTSKKMYLMRALVRIIGNYAWKLAQHLVRIKHSLNITYNHQTGRYIGKHFPNIRGEKIFYCPQHLGFHRTWEILWSTLKLYPPPKKSLFGTNIWNITTISNRYLWDIWETKG